LAVVQRRLNGRMLSRTGPTAICIYTGTTGAQILAVFKTSEHQEVSLSDWLTHTPPELVAQHLNIDASVVRQFPNKAPGFLPV
jgi:oxalate decarboxylase/phosphoglucose isomerase-like protein (cupin superfamily)